MTSARQARRGASDLLFAGLAIASGAVLVYLGRSTTFWLDDWYFVTFSGTTIDYLRPYNGHWVTLPLVLHRVTFDLFGLRSYLPYLGEVVVLHLVAVTGAYVLMRRRLEWLPATLLSLPLLLLGAGAENLFWAFQTTLVGSTMFGIWALVFIERTGIWSTVAASLLLLGSVMCSGMGLAFAVAVLVYTIVESGARLRASAAVAPAVIFGAWYVLLRGEGYVEQDYASPLDTALFVLRGTAHATGAITGLGFSPEGRLVALAVFAVFAYASLRSIAAGHARPLAAACVAGVVVIYALVGVARADLTTEYVTRSRFAYCAAFLIVLCISDWLPSIWARLSESRSTGTIAAAVFIGGIAAATASNIASLADIRAQARQQADFTRAYVSLSLANYREPWVDADDLSSAPPPSVVVKVVRAHGSPLEDELIPAVARAPSPRAFEAALVRMVGRGFRVESADSSAVQAPVSLISHENVSVSRDRACATARATGEHATVLVRARSGSRVRVTSTSSANAYALLSRAWPSWRYIDLRLSPGVPRDILVPDIGDGRSWRVELALPTSAKNVQICSVRG